MLSDVIGSVVQLGAVRGSSCCFCCCCSVIAFSCYCVAAVVLSVLLAESILLVGVHSTAFALVLLVAVNLYITWLLSLLLFSLENGTLGTDLLRHETWFQFYFVNCSSMQHETCYCSVPHSVLFCVFCVLYSFVEQFMATAVRLCMNQFL